MNKQATQTIGWSAQALGKGAATDRLKSAAVFAVALILAVFTAGAAFFTSSCPWVP